MPHYEITKAYALYRLSEVSVVGLYGLNANARDRKPQQQPERCYGDQRKRFSRWVTTNYSSYNDSEEVAVSQAIKREASSICRRRYHGVPLSVCYCTSLSKFGKAL